MDEGGNAVEGTSVTFSVTQGQGSFLGQPQSMRVTDSSGMAETSFTLGLTTGTVLVQASFDGMQGQAPIFSVLSLEVRPGTPTAIVGTVINERNELLPGIRIYITTPVYKRVLTDENGFFRLEPVLPIAQILTVDGFRSGVILGKTYPRVSYPITAIEGQDNSIGMPSILPALDPESFIDVSETQGGTLTLRANPLWKLSINPGQARFADGTRTGRIYVQFVPPDKTPMPMSEGKISRFEDTVQPPNAIFDPPAQVSFPNVDNLAPGTVTDIFTLDYTRGVFLKTGRGRVSENRSVIDSLPGEGIGQGGWHQAAPPTPSPTTNIAGNVQGCASHFTTCGQSATVDPSTGRFFLPGVPLNCDPPGQPGGAIGPGSGGLLLPGPGGVGVGGIMTCEIPPDPKPPGDCDPPVYEALKAAERAACGTRATPVLKTCEGVTDCSELRTNENKFFGCLVAEQALNNTCFGGGDSGHRTEFRNHLKGLRKCRKALIDNKCR